MASKSEYIPYASLDENTSKHVQNFSDLLLSKGYTSNFVIGHEVIGKFPNGLKDHVESALRKQQDFTLFYCEGYTDWRGPSKDSVSIFFKVNYTPERGFLIGNIDIKRKNMNSVTLASATVQPTTNRDMPTAEECNRLVSEPKQQVANKTRGTPYPALPRRHSRGFKH